MFSVVRTLIDRFKALFIMHAVLELEADLIATCAEHKAELLRQADRYDQEGLHGIAQHLRQQVESLSTVKPLDHAAAPAAQLQVEAAESSKPTDTEPQILPATVRSLVKPAEPATRQAMIEFIHALARHYHAVLGIVERVRC